MTDRAAAKTESTIQFLCARSSSWSMHAERTMYQQENNTKCGSSGETVCCVPGCKSNSKKTKNVSWHQVPKDQNELQNFLKIIKRAGKTSFSSWQPKYFHRICGLHFNRSGVRTKHDKCLLFNLPGQSSSTSDSQQQNAAIIVPNVQKEMNIIHRTATTSSPETGDQAISATVLATQTAKIKFGSSDDRPCNHTCSLRFQELEQRLMEQQAALNKALQKCADVEKEKEDILRTNRELKNQVINLQLEITKIQTGKPERCEFQCLSITNIRADEEKLRFYTSFEDAQLYQSFAELIRPQYMKAQEHVAQIKYGRNNHVTSLSFDNQLFLVLTYLRLGLLQEDLAYRFHVSQATVSRILTFWLPLLCSQLEQIPIWPPKELISKYMPSIFQELYPNTRVIIDCTEVFIQTPSDYNVQSVTYSQYKSHNTAKGLIGIAPNGYVTFVSDLYGGRISDKEITKQSRLLELLEEGDHIMAERGFLIEDLCKQYNVTLNMPPLLRGKKQFSPEEDEVTKKIASVRVHVERAIGRIKQFRVLQYAFPFYLEDMLYVA